MPSSTCRHDQEPNKIGDSNGSRPESESTRSCLVYNHVSHQEKYTRRVLQECEEIKVQTMNVATKVEETGRERLKKHRIEVAGRVWIPEIWGQEELLKDWIDCCGFDASLMNSSIMSARAALIEEGRRATSSRLRVEKTY